MGRREVNCLGVVCMHFKEFYQVDKVGEHFIPRFGQTTKHCSHSAVYKAIGSIDDTGTLIHTLKECPNETNNKR
jgi:hypothetical protein